MRAKMSIFGMPRLLRLGQEFTAPAALPEKPGVPPLDLEPGTQRGQVLSSYYHAPSDKPLCSAGPVLKKLGCGVGHLGTEAGTAPTPSPALWRGQEPLHLQGGGPQVHVEGRGLGRAREMSTEDPPLMGAKES